MTDIPIIMSGPMVRALDREATKPGTGKTMTRRLAWRLGRPHDCPLCAGTGVASKMDEDECDKECDCDDGKRRDLVASTWQHVKPGDRLWVREAWGGPVLMAQGADFIEKLLYRATEEAWRDHKGQLLKKWAPSIHMPRSASRFTLIVTATKIERLQEITEEDARVEGVEPRVSGAFADGTPIKTYRTGFVYIWRDLHGEQSWLDNPEVVALSFAVHKANIDHLYDPPAGFEEVGQWHAKACPLHEINENDCAYDETRCNCGFELPESA